MLVIHTPKLLEKILGYSFLELSSIAQQLKTKNRKYYYSFTQIKIGDNGKVKERPIDPSRFVLRDIQNKIKDRILKRLPYPNHISGGLKNRSNITNAVQHRSRVCHFQTDLTKFFQFITCRMVFEMFRSHGFSPEISRVLTQLTTYNGHVPQGAPTSTYIANLVGLNFDQPLLEICNNNNIKYTRFIDDLWFSSNNDITPLIPKLLEILNKKGFLYSHRKTINKKGKVEGTGCMLRTNGRLTITAKQKRKLDNPNLPEKSRAGLLVYKDLVERS